jgi:hypothetical protein
MVKNKGFLMAESFTALLIAFLSLSLFLLVFAEGKRVEANLELKTDRAYAAYILRQKQVKQLKVHDRIYRQGDQ